MADEPAAVTIHSNENTNAAGNRPVTDTHTGSSQPSNQSPNDFKTFFEFLAKKEDDRILKEEEWARKDEERAKELCDILRKLLESSTEGTIKQKAVVEAIKPNPSLDPKDKFWNAYKTASEEHDGEFRAKHNGSLNTSLIFAGLFSTVSSTFIIQIQPNLTQNPDDVTQALLRLLIHSINGSIFSGPDIIIPTWNGPPSSIVAVEGMLYISLFSTLLAALLAVLGKQWLAYYARVGMRGTIKERGIERQKKFNGYRRWGFEYVMMSIPILLQISLLLFGAAITVYLWGLQRTIAGIVLVISLAGIVAYLFFVLSDIFASDSPFRTPLSTGLLKIGLLVKIGSLSVTRLVNDILLSSRNHLCLWIGSRNPGSISLQERDDRDIVALERTIVQQPADEWEYPRRETPLLEPQAMENRDEYDCLAVLWMLETSTDPDVVAIAGSMALDLQWSFNINFVPPLTRLRDSFMGCFDDSPGLKLRESAMNHAVTFGQAYYHLYIIRRSAHTPFQSEDHDVGFPGDFFNQIIGSGSYMRPFDSAELSFVYSQLRDEFSWIEYSSFSSSFFRWALHISPYYCYFKADPAIDLPTRTMFDHIQPSSPGVVDLSSFTNVLLYLGSFLRFPLNIRDLAVIDKSRYCEKVLEELLQYLMECNPDIFFSGMVCGVLETIVSYLKNMDRQPDFSDDRYRESIYEFCRAIPIGNFKTETAFAAMPLVSIFQKDRPVVFNFTHASGLSSNEDEWVRDVSEYIYQRLDDVYADNEWDDLTVRNIEDHLEVLIQVPCFGQYKPPQQFLRILSNSMSPGGKEREHLRHLAFSVVWLACDYWFDDEDLWPTIQQLNIFSRLGPVVDGDIMRHGSPYMHMVAKLSGMRAWVPTIRHDAYRWINLYQRPNDSVERESLEQNFNLAFNNVVVVDDEELNGVETENAALWSALTAMGNVWRNFDFSTRIAIESFCPLAKWVWTVLDPVMPGKLYHCIRSGGEPFFALLIRALPYTYISQLESQTGMGQEEIDAVKGINVELRDIEEYLGRSWQERLASDEHVDLKQTKGSLAEHRRILRRIDELDISLKALLTHSRSYLGMA